MTTMNTVGIRPARDAAGWLPVAGFAFYLSLLLLALLACGCVNARTKTNAASPALTATEPLASVPDPRPVSMGSYPTPPPCPPVPLCSGPRNYAVALGTVVGISGRTLLVQAEPSSTTVHVQPTSDVSVHPATSTWADIKIGDHIDGFGADDANRVLTVQSIDVNATQVWGTVAAVTADRTWLVSPEARHTEVSIPRDSEGRVRVVFDPALPVKDSHNQAIPLQTLLSVPSGTEVMVEGVRAPSATSVTAVTLIGTMPNNALEP